MKVDGKVRLVGGWEIKKERGSVLLCSINLKTTETVKFPDTDCASIVHMNNKPVVLLLSPVVVVVVVVAVSEAAVGVVSVAILVVSAVTVSVDVLTTIGS